MKTQDEMRVWIRNKAKLRGRGTRKLLADLLGLSADQITRMLNMDKEKEIRAIKADEWLKIKHFFAPEESVEENEELVALERECLNEFYNSFSRERQKRLVEFAKFLSQQAKD